MPLLHPSLPPGFFRGRKSAVARGLVVGAVLWASGVPFAGPLQPSAAQWVRENLRSADFGGHTPSPDARHLANWIAGSNDNQHSDFIIVDKKHATLYVFSGQARLLGMSPVLLGAAVGDDSVPGIGMRPLGQVRPEERTTPAGRFIAERGHNARGEDVVWVDYEAAVSMHRVLRTNPKERRLERLASASIADNRISWGCINVPVAFYENTVRPIFSTHRAPVYVLPEVKPVQQVFGSYEVGPI